MIHDDPSFFDAYLRSDFEQLRRFLRSRDAPEEQYRLAAASRTASDGDEGATLVATYAADRYRDGEETAWVTWPTPSGPARVRTGLSEAIFIIAFAFDRPENLRLLTDLPADADPAHAAAALGLDRGVLARGVAQYMPGSYVAPDGGGWAYYLVEPYGEILVIADGPQAAPLLQMRASADLRQAQDLAGRMAAFVVPVTANSAGA